MRRKVVVLDYGFGNLRSAQRALQRAGADVEVTADPETALHADGLVVPGVGAFAACMAGLRAVRGEIVIGKRLAGSRPVLGICVGMQILFAEGVEHGDRTEGCGEWPGLVRRLNAPVLPHMGWNTVTAPAGSRLLSGIGGDARFYFVHSYAATSTAGSRVRGASAVTGSVNGPTPASSTAAPRRRHRTSPGGTGWPSAGRSPPRPGTPRRAWPG